jgi:hypothetical protein
MSHAQLEGVVRAVNERLLRRMRIAPEDDFRWDGRLIFPVPAQLWLYVSFALRNVMLERFVFRWSRATPSFDAVSSLQSPVLDL